MNEFLSKLGAAAKRAADTVSTEVSVAAEEQKIREAYQAIGKLCYQSNKEGKEVGAELFAEHFAKVDAAMTRIKELKDRKNVTADVVADDEDFVTVE